MLLEKLFSGFGKSKNKKEELEELIRQGILYEDEFIIMYAKLLRGINIGPVIKNEQEKAKEGLTILLEESKYHKKALEKILGNY